MFDAKQSSLRDVTTYAPVRIVLVGVSRVIFGALVLFSGAVLAWAAYGGDMGKGGEQWWMMLVGAVLAFAGLALLSGGVGRIVSAFADGYFRAGAEGVAVRLPRQGWFGRFKLVEYQYRWNEIEKFIYFTHSVNGIPMSRELRIRLYGGKEARFERFYFSASVKRLATELSALAARAGV